MIAEENKHVFWLLVLYFLSYGLMLFNQGYYWDDWVMVGVEPKEVLDVFRQLGSPFAWVGHFHNLLLSSDNSIFLYRILIFVCYMFSGLFFYRTLNSFPLKPNQGFFIAAFFIILPVNSARVAIINSPYALCYLAFFAGLYIVSSNRFRKITFKLLAALLFVFSFNTASFLVFYYSVVIPGILYFSWPEVAMSSIKKTAINGFKKTWVWILLPVLFYILKSMIWKPYGLYQGYNQIQLSSILLPFTLFGKSLLKTAGMSASFLPVVILLGSVGSLIAWKKNHAGFIKNLSGWTIGLVLTWSAAFPYLLINLVPEPDRWNSRHQLLYPAGLAIMIFFTVQILANDIFKKSRVADYLYFLVLAFFLSKNNLKQIEFGRDHLAQVSLMRQFSSNNIVRDQNQFSIVDKAKPWVNRRALSFYEYSGMFRKVFGDQRRWGSIPAESSFLNNEEFLTEKYNLKDFKPTSQSFELRIQKGADFYLLYESWHVARSMLRISHAKDLQYLSLEPNQLSN